jgi:hypothetical protein
LVELFSDDIKLIKYLRDINNGRISIVKKGSTLNILLSEIFIPYREKWNNSFLENMCSRNI